MADKQKTDTMKPSMGIAMISLPLLHFLFPEHGRKASRFTRGEAFIDLLQRHEMYLAIEGRFINASISGLSKVWKWDRKTTADFLMSLHAFGIITLVTQGRKTVPRLSDDFMDNCQDEAENKSQPTRQKPKPRSAKADMPTLPFEDDED